MSTLTLAITSDPILVTRVVQFTYSHPTRVVRSECRLARYDSAPAESRQVDTVLLERFGERGTILLPAHFPDEAKALVAGTPNSDWRLECVLRDEEGREVRAAHAQWLSKTRYFYPEPGAPASQDGTTTAHAALRSGGARSADLVTWNLGTLPAEPVGVHTKEYAAWFFVVFDSHAQSDLFEHRWEQYGSSWFPLRSIEVEFRKKCVDRLLPPLVGRVAMRHAGALAADSADPDGAGGAPSHSDLANRPLIAYVSQFQLAIIDLFYPSWRTQGVEASGLAQAFEWFAGGDLLVRMYPGAARNTYNITDGAPTGPFIFLFAEFALYAIENGIDAHAWSRLLPLLNSIQEIYRHAFGTPGKAMECRAYRERHISQSPRPIGADTMRDIRTQRGSFPRGGSPGASASRAAEEMTARLRGMFSDGYRPYPVDWSETKA